MLHCRTRDFLEFSGTSKTGLRPVSKRKFLSPLTWLCGCDKLDTNNSLILWLCEGHADFWLDDIQVPPHQGQLGSKNMDKILKNYAEYTSQVGIKPLRKGEGEREEQVRFYNTIRNMSMIKLLFSLKYNICRT